MSEIFKFYYDNSFVKRTIAVNSKRVSCALDITNCSYVYGSDQQLIFYTSNNAAYGPIITDKYMAYAIHYILSNFISDKTLSGEIKITEYPSGMLKANYKINKSKENLTAQFSFEGIPNKLDAIKRLRELNSNFDLKRAKDFVDDLYEHRYTIPEICDKYSQFNGSIASIDYMLVKSGASKWSSNDSDK